MNDLQVLQNKDLKIILNRPLYSSATNALVTLRWLNLARTQILSSLYTLLLCLQSVLMALWITQWSYQQLSRDVHNITQERKTVLRLPLATKNWGKKRVHYHSLKDWNNLDEDIRNAPDIVNLSVQHSSQLFYLMLLVLIFSCSFLSIFNSVYIILYIFYLQISFILLYIV